MAAFLPDELWRHVLAIGVKSPAKSLSYKELCCVSIACRRLRRLSGEDSLWSHLLSSDFPPPTSQSSSSSSSSSSSCKALYRIRFERDKEKKRLAHRRTVMRKESQIAEHLRRIRDIEASLARESDKLKASASELSNLHKVRQASVALKVWQPEVVRGKQKQMVSQCAVPVESRISAVDMEFRLCKQQIAILRKSYEEERRRLDAAKRELESIEYHPLRRCERTGSNLGGSSSRRKEIKRPIDVEGCGKLAKTS